MRENTLLVVLPIEKGACFRMLSAGDVSFYLYAFMFSGGARGGLEGAIASLSEASSPPVGGNFGFLSEEIWQNDVRKLHFSAPLSEAPAPLSEDLSVFVHE